MSGVHFWTEGEPVGQGRISCYGRGRAVHSNDKELRPWRVQIGAAAMLAMGSRGPFDGPVAVSLSFYLPRPKVAAKRLFPHLRPDVDHLVRAFGDAIKGVVVTDDSRIVRLDAQKLYALDKPGLWAQVEEL